MHELQSSNPRKRQRETRPSDISQASLKKPRLSHLTTGHKAPVSLWDSLSKIWLTRRALDELDRRNSQFVTSSRLGPPDRSSKRSFSRHPAPDLRTSARHGGPDLSDLRGYPCPIDTLDRVMSSRQSSSRGRERASIPPLKNTDPTTNTAITGQTIKTKNSGPYDRNFQQILIDGGVYPHRYEYPDGDIPSRPDNWNEIQRRLTKSRASLSPSQFPDEKFDEFARVDAHASKERQVTISVIPLIEGKIKDLKCVSGGIPFNNLDQLPRSTLANKALADASLDKTALVPGNPDLYYGARPEQLDARIRTKLSGHIIPTTQNSLPIAPNFFLAAKGPNGTMLVGESQACYDGALGARGMHSLQSYGQGDTVYDKNAYTISSIYYGGTLKMYTSHPAIGPGGETEYYMTQLKAWALTSDPDTFRRGVAAFRNAGDWAKEKRDDFISTANQRKKNEDQPRASIVDASGGPSQASTFVSAASQDERYTIDSPHQESRTSLNDDSNNTQAHIQGSENSAHELELEQPFKVPAKRTSTCSGGPQESRRRRLNSF